MGNRSERTTGREHTSKTLPSDRAPARVCAVVAIAASLLGCMGDPDFGAGTSGLYDVTPDVDPLPGVAESAWQDAPADCEGRLDALDDLRFAVASVQYGLVAAVDDEGHVVCVDTLDGVQDELNANGHPEDASELGLRFIAVANLGVPLIDLAAADPSPQPSVTADPSPQPSTDPRVPDPTM